MTKNVRSGIPAGIILLLFGTAAWQLPRVLEMSGARAGVLRAGLIVFGLVAAALTLLVLRAREKNRADADAGDDLDQMIAAAEERLASSSLTSESRLARLPLALVLGPRGSTKSSILMNSGLDPELLAGEVMRGEAVVPTDPGNVSYAQGTIFVEAGGALLEDADRWRRLVRQLQPRRFAAALGHGRQSPRIAIVTFPCDEFLKPGASQNIPVMARVLRARLSEASQQLGIRLPVYLLFTRTDRLPFFTDYVRSLSSTEAQQVLGATLPLAGEASGSWAERESLRLNAAFARIVDALGARRLELLPREMQSEVRGGVYEFPRELRKILEPAVQLMLDVFRPSQLGVNPFLRGFYFTGVRPVILSDIVAEITPPQPSARSYGAGATSVFNAALVQQAMQQAAAHSGGARKVPQWVFLHRFFQEVVLRDDVALRITGGGTRVDLLRRGLIAAAAAACVVLILGFTVSYANNRSLIRGSITAITEARDVGRMPGARTTDELVRLDALRERAEQVSQYQRNGRPMLYAFGLYTGSQLQPLLNRAYFDRFNDVLWNETRAGIIGYLDALPERPNEDSDFSSAQDALAAYLLTTSMSDRSEPGLLTPALLTHRQDLAANDSILDLVRRQFDFFAIELAQGNVERAAPEDQLVIKAQSYLREFGPEVYYRVLISEAERTGPAIVFSDPSGVVAATAVVPAAFTRAGRDRVLENLDSIDNLFTRNEWIYGGSPPASKPERQELAARYHDEYVRQWQNFLDRASVQQFASAGDASARIGLLAGSSSPLLTMLAVASRETALDSLSLVGRAFQPLHATVPPADPRGAGANLSGYFAQLSALSSQLNLLRDGAAAGDEEGRRQASAAADRVAMEAAALASGYIVADAARGTGQSVQRLLRQPAQFAQSIVTRLPDAVRNQAAADFCAEFRNIERSYPFTRGGRDAPPAAVALIFAKQSGLLWSFYDQHLRQTLNEQGRPLSGQRVNASFQRFFTQASAFSQAVYGPGSTAAGGAPLIEFNFVPYDLPEGATEVTLQEDRTSHRFSRTAATSTTISWRPETGTSLRLVVSFGDNRETVVDATGPWAAFRLFEGTTWSSASGGQYQVEWRVNGRGSLRARVRIDGEPVLRPGALSALSSCASRVLN